MSESNESFDDFVMQLRDLNIKNIFIYVGDAVRYDYIPDTLRDKGVLFKTVAASTHSPTSFASLVSGQPAFMHGVSSFKTQIRGDVFRLFDMEGYHTEFVNSIVHEERTDPIFSVLDTEPEPESDFPKKLSEPYIVMERGQGGHAPYSPEYSTAVEYFNNVNPFQTGTVQRDYEAAVERDVQQFFHRLQELNAGNDTLVIYTSDHGELIGEGGMFGHTSPMRPELVYVPTIFIHPELPTGSLNNSLFRHTDLLPTLLQAIGYDGNQNEALLNSISLSDSDTNLAMSRYQLQFLSAELPGVSGELYFEGVWGKDGGYVFPRSSFSDRLIFFLGKISNSDKRMLLGRHFLSAFRSYMKGDAVYGSPSFSKEKAEKYLESVPMEEAQQEEYELSNDDMEQLRDLGYI